MINNDNNKKLLHHKVGKKVKLSKTMESKISIDSLLLLREVD